MADDGDNGNVGFEDGLSWLPSHIFHEACGDLSNEVEHRRSGFKSHTRPRYKNNRTSGGPGMQAVFLEPARKTCGTGVFLPRRAGTELKPSKNSICSPVLLPYRVVQALNLNVQGLGLQISPHEGQKKRNIGRYVHHSASNKNVETIRDHRDMRISSDQHCSPELFLPKEWSY
ncbi:hypothetical protein vseg_010732 [Gypsophila vaccaria]